MIVMRVRGLPLVSWCATGRRRACRADPPNLVAHIRTWGHPNRAITSASRHDIPRECSQKMALKIPFAALTVAVIARARGVRRADATEFRSKPGCPPSFQSIYECSGQIT